MSDTPLEPAEIKVDYHQFQISSIIGWIECNGYKPHLYVHPQHPGVRLPTASMAKDIEVINASTSAVYKMQWFDDRLEFNARFGGRDHRLVIPYFAIKSIGFAGTETMIPLPWCQMRAVMEAEGGNQPASLAEAPPETFYVPEDVKPPTTDAAEAASNVRQVDFKAPRKPKS